LGEGEFGKVKLAVYSSNPSSSSTPPSSTPQQLLAHGGGEVAIKLIKRGNVDTSARAEKVKREIEVLKKVRHPNVVRLWDVIETEKYIGIVLEFASGTFYIQKYESVRNVDLVSFPLSSPSSRLIPSQSKPLSCPSFWNHLGGELFDHILAHRYLREKDAIKLFSQLISGVSYLHKKKIVHRDLKLENLLLDRNRNVIITDFGFANWWGDEGGEK
jgi:serine/threonine protein kinase